jgi:hypothetical protein
MLPSSLLLFFFSFAFRASHAVGLVFVCLFFLKKKNCYSRKKKKKKKNCTTRSSHSSLPLLTFSLSPPPLFLNFILLLLLLLYSYQSLSYLNTGTAAPLRKRVESRFDEIKERIEDSGVHCLTDEQRHWLTKLCADTRRYITEVPPSIQRRLSAVTNHLIEEGG